MCADQGPTVLPTLEATVLRYWTLNTFLPCITHASLTGGLFGFFHWIWIPTRIWCDWVFIPPQDLWHTHSFTERSVFSTFNDAWNICFTVGTHLKHSLFVAYFQNYFVCHQVTTPRTCTSYFKVWQQGASQQGAILTPKTGISGGL